MATFSATDCGPCPARSLCTTSGRKRRQLTLPPRGPGRGPGRRPRRGDTTIRSRPTTPAAPASRAPCTRPPATAHAAPATAACRKPASTTLYMAVALNLLRLHAYWNGTPLDRPRTSHLARLELGLDLPPRPGDPHELGQRHRVRGVGTVERELAVADPAADQQPVRAVAAGDRRVGGLD